MILFVDGIDGSGKTTLIRRLRDAITRGGTSAYTAEPLWRYLDAITAPEQFGGWVTSSGGLDVAEALMTAMARRVDDLRGRDPQQPHVLLVDRGPKTVYASARAHAKQQRDKLAPVRALLAEAVRALQDSQPCVAVELSTGAALDVALPRIELAQAVTPRYLRYLHAFSEEMDAESDWPDLPAHRLSPSAPVDQNCRATVEALGRASSKDESYGQGREPRRS
ncbi:hypothetical protein [Verrucosispora sp. TAA-831]|uniref:hypothetical protein n=1 Tax=Verrucosispora sp. TAA-831 TaxID=3422227 RepID=UPI003D6F4414